MWNAPSEQTGAVENEVLLNNSSKTYCEYQVVISFESCLYSFVLTTLMLAGYSLVGTNMKQLKERQADPFLQKKVFLNPQFNFRGLFLQIKRVMASNSVELCGVKLRDSQG